jgi:tetratricopeptide (TPR) repeat protein
MINKLNSFDLNLKWQFPNLRNYTFAFVSLFVFLLIIYGNSFNCEWQFDDIPNIVENVNVHLKSLFWTDIKKSFHITPAQGLPRPVAYLSFGLNYYSGGLNVFGYHVVNFIIHYLAALFLFLFIFNTLNLPLLKEKYRHIAYPVTLLAVTLWATNPVQVNAVTYIVQRMTSLSGMAYIMSMYFYLKGRTSDNHSRSILFFMLCVLSALISFGSKENAAMLPVSLFLYDLFLIQGISRQTLWKNLIIFIFPLSLLITLSAVFLNYSRMIFLNYSQWTFTLQERLLTEPRVILYYISLLLYPVSSRLTIDHDIAISRSLFDPWSTLIAILIILSLIGYAAYTSRKSPLIAYCIIFFFLNHLIEGSFIALDLIFEHRNYLPSMLLFVPAAILLINVLDYFAYRKSVQFIMASGMIFVIAAQAHTVSIRNDIFRYDKLLWEDNVRKTPNLSRPHGALGKIYFDEGNYGAGVIENYKALQLLRYPNYMQPALYNCNLGNYFLVIKNNEDKALFHYKQALKLLPHMSVAHYGVAMVMLRKGSLSQAYENIQQAILYKPNYAFFHNTLAMIHLKRGNYDEAINEADKSIGLSEYYFNPSLAVKAEAFRLKGNPGGSIIYWEKFLSHDPGNLSAHLALLELYDLKGKKKKLLPIIGALLFLKGKKSLAAMIDEMAAKKDLVYTPKKEVLLPIIEKSLKEAS